MREGLNRIVVVRHDWAFLRQEAGDSFCLTKKKPKSQGLFLRGSKTTLSEMNKENSLRSHNSLFSISSNLFFHAPSQMAGLHSVLTTPTCHPDADRDLALHLKHPTLTRLSLRPSELSEEVNEQCVGPIWKLSERSEFFQIQRSEVYAESSAGLDFFASFFDQDSRGAERRTSELLWKLNQKVNKNEGLPMANGKRIKI